MSGDLNSIQYRPIDSWPGELTRHRKNSPFRGDWRSTIRLLSDEVDHLTADNVDTLIVIQLAATEREIRKDGTGLLAHAHVEHPGVIVSFEANRGPLRFSCDRFDAYGPAAGWRANVRAIALGLEALRKIDRYGIGSGGEQYTGFGALPPGQPLAMGPAMTLDEAERLLGLDLIDRYDVDTIRLHYRGLSKHHHPDAGGDPDTFRRLTEARDLLLGRSS